MRSYVAHGALSITVALALLVSGGLGTSPSAPAKDSGLGRAPASSVPSNLSATLNRLVQLLALAGGGVLALVWARVALSWFSTDISKKIQAKERARDALIGTIVFTAAVTGVIWGLAQWVVTGG